MKNFADSYDVSSINVGDKLLVTPMRGPRFAMRVTSVWPDQHLVSGPQTRILDLSTPTFPRNRDVRVGSQKSVVKL